MIKLIMDTDRCKSCGYCIRDCPVKALQRSAQLNSEGYTYVEVDETRCILCGTCYTVCPDLVFELREVDGGGAEK